MFKENEKFCDSDDTYLRMSKYHRLFEVKVLNHNLRNCRTIFDPIDNFFMEVNKLSFLPVIALTKIIHGLHLGRNKLYSFQSFYREI